MALPRIPTILDSGVEGHIIKNQFDLIPHSVRPTNTVTEPFSGAQAPIACIGDHQSGQFPNCHVVPRTAFNLVAVGPYLDYRGPNHAVILTSTRALQLSNVNFDEVALAPDPRRNLISHQPATTHQLERRTHDTHQHHRIQGRTGQAIPHQSA